MVSGIWVVGEWKGKGIGGGEVDGLDGEVLCGRVFDMGIMPLYIAKAFSLCIMLSLSNCHARLTLVHRRKLIRLSQ